VPKTTLIRTRKAHADKIDQAFASKLISDFDIDLSSKSVTKADAARKDILRIISMYRDYIQDVYHEDPYRYNTIEFCGLPLHTGFNLLYGPPDIGKTIIGVSVANYAHEAGYRVCFVDSENKLMPGLLKDGILYIRGTANSYMVAKKLCRNNQIDMLIVDTVVCLSNHSQLIRSLCKFASEYGIYVLFLDQTRHWRFGQYNASGDMVMDICKEKHRLVSRRKYGSRSYISTDTGIRFVFDIDGNNITYNQKESALAVCLANGVITKIRRKFFHNGKEYDREGIYKVIGAGAGKDIPAVDKKEIQTKKD